MLHPPGSHAHIGLQHKHDAAVGGEVVDGAGVGALCLRGVAEVGEPGADGHARLRRGHGSGGHLRGHVAKELQDVGALHPGHEKRALLELRGHQIPLRRAARDGQHGFAGKVVGGGRHTRITNYELPS